MVKGGSGTSSEKARRLLRGGSWFDFPWLCRSATRLRVQPLHANSGVGFRVVCIPQDPSLNA